MRMNFYPNLHRPANHTGYDTCALYKVMTKTIRAKIMPNDKDGNDNEERKKERKNDESKMKSEINRLTSDYGIKTGSQLFCILFSTIMSISE
jgi:hypothetical protein